MKKIISILVLSFAFFVAKSQQTTEPNARFRIDSLYMSTTTTAVLDTGYYIGTSYTNGVGAPSVALAFATLSANKIAAIAKIRGTNGEVMENRSPVNPFSAPYNGIQDTASVPTFTALGRYLVIELSTNDAVWTTANYTPTNFVADYTTYMNHVINVAGWPPQRVLLVGVGYEATSVLLQDSITFSLPFAPTQARFKSYDSCTQVVANNFGTKFLSMRNLWLTYSNNTPQLLQYVDSIHPNDQGHRFYSDGIAKALGYTLTKSNQQLAVNGLSELNTAKIRLFNPLLTTNFTALGVDSSGAVGAADNMFLTNNPVVAQPFLGNITQGIVSHWAQPDFMRITSGVNIGATSALGTVLQNGGLEFQFVSNVGYIGTYNRTTATGLPLVLGLNSTYTSILSNAQYNSAVFNVTGIADFASTLWVGSTSSSTGIRFLISGNSMFLDAEAANLGYTWRTNSASLASLHLDGGNNGAATFGNLSNQGKAQVESFATTTQFASMYDATHLMTITTASTGTTSFKVNSNSANQFTFNSAGNESMSGALTATGTPTVLMHQTDSTISQQTPATLVGAVMASGQTTLVSGTKAITVTGVTTSSKAFVTLVSPTTATLTVQYQVVCSSNTVTIQANVAATTINVADGSTVNYLVIF